MENYPKKCLQLILWKVLCSLPRKVVVGDVKRLIVVNYIIYLSDSICQMESIYLDWVDRERTLECIGNIKQS